MDKKRIVITGIGVVAPNGIGKEEFWNNCAAGVSGIRPITLFNASKYHCRYAGEISDFKPADYLGPKGLRNLDRTTLLAMVAANLALEDSALSVTKENRDRIGVVLGSTMGSVRSTSEFDKSSLVDGPRYVNPGLFPNTVMNSPASQVAIRLGVRGLNSTVATGFTAGVDALGYAFDMIRFGRADAILVGGSEELSPQSVLGCERMGFFRRTGSEGNSLERGFVLGEGSVVFVLESRDRAINRSARIYGELLGYASRFYGRYSNLLRESHREAILCALNDARVSARQIQFIGSSGEKIKTLAVEEDAALQSVFGSSYRDRKLDSIKKLVGELLSAGGVMQVAEALRALSVERARRIEISREALSLVCVSESECVLVSCIGVMGILSCLVIGRTFDTQS